jgi:hypothetical protein
MFDGICQVLAVCQHLFPGRVRWLLENVPIDPTTAAPARARDEAFVRAVLGSPAAVFDAVQVGGRAARVRSFWSNLFCPLAFSAGLAAMPAPDFSVPLDAYLDHPARRVGVWTGAGHRWNQHGVPVSVFPTFTTAAHSWAFHPGGGGCVYERGSRGWVPTVPSALERARIMGFAEDYLGGLGWTATDQCFFLGQSADQSQCDALWGFAVGYGLGRPGRCGGLWRSTAASALAACAGDAAAGGGDAEQFDADEVDSFVLSRARQAAAGSVSVPAAVQAISGLNLPTDGDTAAGEVIRQEAQATADLEEMLGDDDFVPLPAPGGALTDEQKWEILRQSLADMSPELTPVERAEAEQCIRHALWAGTFAFDLTEIGECTVGEPMTITLKPGAIPVFQKARRISERVNGMRAWPSCICCC